MGGHVDDLDDMPATQLKLELKLRGLDRSGNKAQLVARLLQAHSRDVALPATIR